MIETVWELKLYFKSPSRPSIHHNKVVKAELNKINVGEGFFKKTPYIVGKRGIGYMKKTKIEVLKILAAQLKRYDDFTPSVEAIKQIILEEFPEILI